MKYKGRTFRAHQHNDARKPNADPTGTIDIRRRVNHNMQASFRKVQLAMRAVIVDHDLLETRALSPRSVMMAAARGVQTGSPITATFGPDNKILAFQNWLDQTLANMVLQKDAPYLRDMVQLVWRRASVRASRLMGRDAQETFNLAQNPDKVAALHRLAYVELQGIVEAVSQQCVRAVADAILNKTAPATLVRKLQDVIKKIGVTRSRAMVSLIVVKAHSDATLDAFEASGVKRVRLIPELVPPKVLRKDSVRPFTDAPRRQGPGANTSREATPSRRTVERIRATQKRLERRMPKVEVATAGDDDVCPICEDIEEGGPYTINAARSLIPAHPNCRCAFVPADEDDVDDSFADYNENHDPETGEFTSGPGGGSSGGSGKGVGVVRKATAGGGVAGIANEQDAINALRSRGFAGKPQVVSDRKQLPRDKVYRSVSNEAAAENEVRGDEYRMGGGLLGKAIYVGENKARTKAYGGKLLEGGLAPGANIANISKVYADMKPLKQSNPGQYKFFQKNPALFAGLNGYDGVRDPSGQIGVVNRSKLVWLDPKK